MRKTDSGLLLPVAASLGDATMTTEVILPGPRTAARSEPPPCRLLPHSAADLATSSLSLRTQGRCAIEVLLKLDVVIIAAAENGFPIALSCAQGARGYKILCSDATHSTPSPSALHLDGLAGRPWLVPDRFGTKQRPCPRRYP